MTREPELPDALYYLRNFRQAIGWVLERNQDLLSQAELQFANELNSLPIPAQALLARLSMRRGDLFRRSKIRYPEIDPLSEAVDALTQIGWLDPRPQLSLQALFRLASRAELSTRFGELARLTKHAAYEALVEAHGEARSFQEWFTTADLPIDDAVYHVTIAPMVLRYRLLHFGNFYQDWHEYTLAHMQVFKYEPVPLDPTSRPFDSRTEIDFFYALYDCHEAARNGAELPEVLALLPEASSVTGWLRRRWDRLRFHLGQHAERAGDIESALAMYQGNAEPEASVRHVRVLECLKRDEDALSVGRALLAAGSSELIAQRVSRVMSRLERRRGAKPTRRVPELPWAVSELSLTYDPDERVEALVQAQLSSADAPVFYVENGLICSLFGLLCWDAIFEPVRGATFHPFQSAPADLGCVDFVTRRRATFDACLKRLDTGKHAEFILHAFAEKYGTRAPFVHWLAVDEPILQLALHSMPTEHLKLYFTRILEDVSANTSGFPDLVQFFPENRSYRLIEVKGPGDRVQDNQRRWLQFCVRHQLPVEVCQVSWV